MPSLSLAQTIPFESARRQGRLASRKRTILNDCQTLPTSVSGAIVTVEDFPDRAPNGATRGWKIAAPAGDTYVEVRQALAATFQASAQDALCVLVRWPNGQSGGFGLALASDNFAAKRIALTKTAGTGYRADDGWMFLNFPPAEDGTTAPNGETWTASGGMALTETINALGIVLASAGGFIHVAEISRFDCGTPSKPSLQIGFDAFTVTPQMVGDTANGILLASGFRGYWAGDANLIRDIPAAKKYVTRWYDSGHDVISQGMWHADPTQFSNYNPSTPQRYPNGQGYALNPTTLAQDFDDAAAILASFGMTRCNNMFSYPFSASSAVTDATLAQKGVVLCRGANSFAPSLTPSEFGPSLRYIPHTGFNIGGNTLTKAKKYVDACVLYGLSGNIYCHGLTSGGTGAAPPADPLLWYDADYQALITYIKQIHDSGRLDVLSPSQWYERYAA